MRPRDWMAWWGHVRTRGGGGPALQPVRALAAGLQSPEGHTEPGLAPQTAGGRCSQSIQTRCATPSPCPAAAQVTRPPGTATPKSGEDSTEGAGEEAVPRFRRECGSTCTGTGDGETEPGRRPRRLEAGVGWGGTEAGGRCWGKNGGRLLHLGEETEWGGPPRRRPPAAWKRHPCLRLVTSGAYMPTAALCPPGAQSIPAGGR